MSALSIDQVISIGAVSLRVREIHPDHVRVQVEWTPAKGTRHIRQATVPLHAAERLAAASVPANRPFAFLTPLEPVPA